MLVIAAQLVVARKARKPRPGLVAIFEAHRPAATAANVRQGKPVPTLRTFRSSSSAGVLADDPRPTLVNFVAAAALHKRSHQAAHGPEIELLGVVLEDVVQDIKTYRKRVRSGHAALTRQGSHCCTSTS